ncbi:MAG: di-trans,poly-cis-decaprenylcistransferase [Chloroflexi bacterium]|nr:di-trans,poly-cis-decaprenylcistransferase [Chloroflexota bacterium]
MPKTAKIKPLPQHVAIIMDGNGRWAQQRGLSRLEGHKQGGLNARRVVETFIEYKVPYLTLYAFSTENWNRPREEVEGLFRLLEEKLDEGDEVAREKKITVRHLGRLEGLPRKIQRRIEEAVEQTKRNTGMTLCLAFNYGGRDEIVQATQRMMSDKVDAKKITEATFRKYLYSEGIPDPDLIIRTGGEMRLSNFLTWQSAYAEIYFTPVLWPDFDKKEIEKALAAYSKRQRRFGQVESG